MSQPPGRHPAVTAQGQAPSPETTPRGAGRTFQALGYRDFRFLWVAQLAYAGALWVWLIALPLLVLRLTPSPVHLGAVMAARTVPAVAFGLFAGAVADTFNRRRVLLLAQAMSFITSLLFAVIIMAGRIELWHVYVFATLLGASMAFDQPARRAIIPSVLPESLVTNAMALNMGSVQIMRVFGAAGAGLLAATVGIGSTFLVAALFFGLAMAMVVLARVPDYQRSGYQGASAMTRDLVDGFRFAWQSPSVRGVLIVAMVYFVFGASFMQVFAPLLAKDTLGIGDAGFGAMMALAGVGGGVGALILATANPTRRRGVLLLITSALFGVTLVAFSLSTYVGWIPLVFLMAAALGVGQTFIFPLVNAVLLNSAPLEMRGRVMGLLSLDRAMISLGSVIAGFLAAATGPQMAQIIFGLSCVLAAALMGAFVRRVE